MKNNVYEQLKALSLPFIEIYHDDLLKHDRNIIAKHPGLPFLHFTGATGTHIVIMHPADHERFPKDGEIVPYLFGTADRHHILEGKKVTVEGMSPDWRQSLILYFNGNKLKKIPYEKTKEIIRDYVNEVRSKWSRERQAA